MYLTAMSHWIARVIPVTKPWRTPGRKVDRQKGRTPPRQLSSQLFVLTMVIGSAWWRQVMSVLPRYFYKSFSFFLGWSFFNKGPGTNAAEKHLQFCVQRLSRRGADRRALFSYSFNFFPKEKLKKDLIDHYLRRLILIVCRQYILLWTQYQVYTLFSL